MRGLPARRFARWPVPVVESERPGGGGSEQVDCGGGGEDLNAREDSLPSTDARESIVLRARVTRSFRRSTLPASPPSLRARTPQPSMHARPNLRPRPGRSQRVHRLHPQVPPFRAVRLKQSSGRSAKVQALDSRCRSEIRERATPRQGRPGARQADDLACRRRPVRPRCHFPGRIGLPARRASPAGPTAPGRPSQLPPGARRWLDAALRAPSSRRRSECHDRVRLLRSDRDSSHRRTFSGANGGLRASSIGVDGPVVSITPWAPESVDEAMARSAERVTGAVEPARLACDRAGGFVRAIGNVAMQPYPVRGKTAERVAERSSSAGDSETATSALRSRRQFPSQTRKRSSASDRCQVLWRCLSA